MAEDDAAERELQLLVTGTGVVPSTPEETGLTKRRRRETLQAAAATVAGAAAIMGVAFVLAFKVPSRSGKRAPSQQLFLLERKASGEASQAESDAWACHHYEQGQDDEWCKNTKAEAEHMPHTEAGLEITWFGEDSPCGDCWCCKRPVTERWTCQHYVGDQDNDWCHETETHSGFELKLFGPKSPCGDCWCCKRPLDQLIELTMRVDGIDRDLLRQAPDLAASFRAAVMQVLVISAGVKEEDVSVNMSAQHIVKVRIGATTAPLEAVVRRVHFWQEAIAGSITERVRALRGVDDVIETTPEDVHTELLTFEANGKTEDLKAAAFEKAKRKSLARAAARAKKAEEAARAKRDALEQAKREAESIAKQTLARIESAAEAERQASEQRLHSAWALSMFGCEHDIPVYIISESGQYLQDTPSGVTLGSDTGSTAKWVLSHVGSGDAAEALVFSAHGEEMLEREAWVGLAPRSDEGRQKWTIRNAGDGKVFIESYVHRKLLAANGSVALSSRFSDEKVARVGSWRITTIDGKFACTFGEESVPNFATPPNNKADLPTALVEKVLEQRRADSPNAANGSCWNFEEMELSSTAETLGDLFKGGAGSEEFSSRTGLAFAHVTGLGYLDPELLERDEFQKLLRHRSSRMKRTLQLLVNSSAFHGMSDIDIVIESMTGRVAQLVLGKLSKAISHQEALADLERFARFSNIQLFGGGECLYHPREAKETCRKHQQAGSVAFLPFFVSAHLQILTEQLATAPKGAAQAERQRVFARLQHYDQALREAWLAFQSHRLSAEVLQPPSIGFETLEQVRKIEGMGMMGAQCHAKCALKPGVDAFTGEELSAGIPEVSEHALTRCPKHEEENNASVKSLWSPEELGACSDPSMAEGEQRALTYAWAAFFQRRQEVQAELDHVALDVALWTFQSHRLLAWEMPGQHLFHQVGTCIEADSGDLRLPLKSQEYTIEAWVKPGEFLGKGWIAGWGDSKTSKANMLYLEVSSDRFAVGTGVPGLDFVVNVSELSLLDSFHHIAVSWDGITSRLFVDFEEVAAGVSTGISHELMRGNSLCIGQGFKNSTKQDVFDGMVKDLQIWRLSRLLPQMRARSEPFAVSIGPSQAIQACTNVTQRVVCPYDAGNRGRRINKDFASAWHNFTITSQGGNSKVCARRMDHQDGWDMNLTVQCYTVPEDLPMPLPPSRK